MNEKLREKIVEMRAQVFAQSSGPNFTIERMGWIEILDGVLERMDERDPEPPQVSVEEIHDLIKQHTEGAFAYVGPLDEGYAIVDGTVDIINLTTQLNQRIKP